MKQAVPFLASSLVLSGLLAGCAPSSTGQSSSAPQVLKTPLTPVELAPGETRYVRVDYPRKSLRLGQGYFDKLNIDFSNMSGNNVNSPMEYANWLKMGSPKLPRGVQISLDKAFIVKDIDRTYENSGGTEVYYYEVFRLTYKIQVAASAPAFSNIVELPLTDGVQRDTAQLYLRVRK